MSEDKIKIVMVDDEQDLCLMTKANLEDTGEFSVVTSSDPSKVEDLLRQEQPQVLLLDVVMPARKGPDVIAAVRKDPALKAIPIIIVSGKGEMVFDKHKKDFKWLPNSRLVKERGELPDVKGAEALAEAYGVNDYVAKPFTTELLVEVIKDVLEKERKKAAGSQKKSDDDLI